MVLTLPSSISFFTVRGVTFLPASAMTSPVLASTMSNAGLVPRMRSGKNGVTQAFFFLFSL